MKSLEVKCQKKAKELKQTGSHDKETVFKASTQVIFVHESPVFLWEFAERVSHTWERMIANLDYTTEQWVRKAVTPMNLTE